MAEKWNCQLAENCHTAYDLLESWERLCELGLIDYAPEFSKGLLMETWEKTKTLLDATLGRKKRKKGPKKK